MLACEDTSLHSLWQQEISLKAGKEPYLIPATMPQLKQLSTIPEHLLNLYLTMGAASVLIEDGKPIAAAGVILGQPGLGSAWAMVTDYSKSKPFALHRATVRCLTAIIKGNNLRRVDYIVDPIDAPSVVWAARLGFEYEATMRRFFADGRDAWLCAWVKADGNS